MTGHGFRSIASTLLNEQGWNRDAIERQLAHGERDAVRADYLDPLKAHLPEINSDIRHRARRKSATREVQHIERIISSLLSDT